MGMLVVNDVPGLQSVASATVTLPSSSARASGHGERVDRSATGSSVATTSAAASASRSSDRRWLRWSALAAPSSAASCAPGPCWLLNIEELTNNTFQHQDDSLQLVATYRFGSAEHDGGSPAHSPFELSSRTDRWRPNEWTDHLRTHKHDHYSRRGLLKLNGRRRRFLNYLQKKDLEGYRSLIRELGLRR